MRFVDTNVLLYAVSTADDEAARAAGCPILLTEDLQHGMDFAGVVVENPFA